MEIRKLPADDRPREFYRYEVQGVGLFPIDMLRYDSAWPADSESVEAQGRRTVRLSSYRQPTIDRWSSFGWTVD